MTMQPIDQPSTRITSPRRVADEDRTLPLTAHAATTFATEANSMLATPRAMALLSEHTGTFAQIISADAHFPFIAVVQDGAMQLFYAPNKVPNPVLKNISEGVTDTYKQLIRQCSIGESKKFDLATLFTPAMYKAYIAAGLTTGPHTEYVYRSC